MVKVSIIMPVFNTSNLKKCLDSVVNQTLKHIEIICIDTGLIEYSSDIINEFKTKYSNIQLISNDNNEMTSLYYSVLKNSKGKYIYFVNPDEILDDNHIERLYDSSEEKNSDILIFKSVNGEYGVNDKYNIYSYDLNLLKKFFQVIFLILMI